MAEVSPEYIAALGEIKSRLNALDWAVAHSKIRIGGRGGWTPFSITTPPYLYPFLKEPYFQVGHGGPEHIVLMKGRKVGATTLALNATFYNIDEFKVSALYGLPKERHLRDLVTGVFDPLIRNAPYIQNLFTDTDNQQVKVGKYGSLYFRGAQSAEGVEALATGAIVRDELDQMDPSNAEGMLECNSGSMRKFLLDLGHPRYSGKGIDAEYERSSRAEWNFTCPQCKSEQPLDWDKNVDLGGMRFICSHCGAEIKKSDIWSGRYIHAYPQRPVKGYHISQLLSPTKTLESQIIAWEDAQGVPYKMQNFYNIVLGLPYDEGAKKLTPEDVRKRMIGPKMANYGSGGSMGIDVGAGLHYWIQEDDVVVRLGMAGEWDDLDAVVEAFSPAIVIIDAGPELHAARSFANELRERGVDSWLCIRSSGMEGRRKVDEDKHTITVNVTEQFDTFFSNLNHTKLPIDLPDEAIEHLCAPVRAVRESTGGVMKASYNKGVCHYCDAGSYAREGLIGTNDVGPEIFTKIPLITQKSKWRKF